MTETPLSRSSIRLPGTAYAWAQDHHQPHYNNVPDAAERWQSLYQQFRRHVPVLDGAALAVTLTREGKKKRG